MRRSGLSTCAHLPALPVVTGARTEAGTQLGKTRTGDRTAGSEAPRCWRAGYACRPSAKRHTSDDKTLTRGRRGPRGRTLQAAEPRVSLSQRRECSLRVFLALSRCARTDEDREELEGDTSRKEESPPPSLMSSTLLFILGSYHLLEYSLIKILYVYC